MIVSREYSVLSTGIKYIALRSSKKTKKLSSRLLPSLIFFSNFIMLIVWKFVVQKNKLKT